MASRGLRDMDEGPERMEDPGEVEAVRRQGERIQRRSLLAGLVVAILSLLLP